MIGNVLATLKPLGKSQVFWCAIGAIVSLIWMGTLKQAQHPDYADAKQYIGIAVNLAKFGTVSENINATADTIAPAISREPGYPLLLAQVLKLDGSIEKITGDCLNEQGCGIEPYILAKWTNRLLIVAAGFVMFFAVRGITGSPFAAIMGGMHIWLNHQAHKNHDYVISDPLALFLASLLVFSIVWAWKRKNPLFWIFPGLTFVWLAFTKAIYIYFIPIALLFGFVFVISSRNQWKSSLAKLVIFAIVVTIPIGMWMERNHDITGRYQFTDNRGGIALSTRVVFNDMGLIDGFAALTYWTRGAGDGWAEKLFPAEVVQPFSWYDEDGYYLRGQLGFGKRIDEIIATTNLASQEATQLAEKELKDAILSRPAKHIVTTLPLIYRGIWIDEFAVITFPAFLILLISTIRRRQGLLIAALLPSLFSLVFYAAFSLNLARYQMTALPGFAIAFAYFSMWLCATIQRWHDRKKSSAIVGN
ncbi:hypothetical protein [Thalassospira sp. CH_XMU1448-2]|uniref:hypothetical protein n=1 Tax=Thalassospira sp. CH_XMU1448-2 TaxID=3107773 RepID=UPI003008C86C